MLGRNDVVPGAMITIQAFGQLIHFHPHLHGLLTDGAFTAGGQFIRLPQIDDELLRRRWQQRVFQLLLDEGKIEPKLVEQMRAWRHGGFGVDRCVCLAVDVRAGIHRFQRD